MIIRPISFADKNQVEDIHKKYYGSEFILPDFATNFIGAFVLEEDKKIVTVCGMRTIAETIAITNKDFSPRDRIRALRCGAEAVIYLANNAKFNQLHAFVQDENWEKLLTKIGFNPTKGKSLVLEI